MANDFKAAAERKKKITAQRKGRELVGKIEELLKENEGKVAEEEKGAVLAAADALSKAMDGGSLEDILAAYDGTLETYEAISRQLEKEQQNEVADVDEPKEQDEPAAEVLPEASAELTPEEASAVQETESSDVDAQEQTAQLDIPVVEETVYVKKDAYVYSGPGLKYEKLGSLKKGESIRRVDPGSDGWSKVVFEGVICYISSIFLTADNPKVTEEMPAADETKVSTEDPTIGGVRVSAVLRQLYNAPRYSRVGGETKIRFNALIKPSLREKMKRDQEAGDIHSANDLINALLEMYYEDELED